MSQVNVYECTGYLGGFCGSAYGPTRGFLELGLDFSGSYEVFFGDGTRNTEARDGVGQHCMWTVRGCCFVGVGLGF